MHTKESLMHDLSAIGIQPTDTLLVHSSMKTVGEVKGRAETVLDAFIEYMRPGLLIFPTHTWEKIGVAYFAYNPLTEPSCVGILPNLFLARPGVIHSWHPNRLADARMSLIIMTPDGREIPRPMRGHRSPFGDVSLNFDKMEAPFIHAEFARKGKIGDAESILCDAVGMADLTSAFLKMNPDLFADGTPVPKAWYEG